MNLIKKISLVMGIVTLFSLVAFAPKNNAIKKYKCLVQLTNYEGEGAYVVVSLLSPEEKYEKTLYMFGPEKRWWEEFKNWWGFYKAIPQNIDALTGESIAGGERKIATLEIPIDKIDKGYSLLFESAVEDEEYYKKDVLMPLATQQMKKKIKGTGYIRYVRLLPKK